MWTARACLLYVEVKTSCDDCVRFPMLFRARLKTADTRQIGGCVSSEGAGGQAEVTLFFLVTPLKTNPWEVWTTDS